MRALSYNKDNKTRDCFKNLRKGGTDHRLIKARLTYS